MIKAPQAMGVTEHGGGAVMRRVWKCFGEWGREGGHRAGEFEGEWGRRVDEEEEER